MLGFTAVEIIPNGGGEIGELSVILSNYLRDIDICVLSFFANAPHRKSKTLRYIALGTHKYA